MTRRLSDLLGTPIAFQPAYVDIGGSVCAALFLSQSIYWQKRCGEEWFWKSQDQWKKETGLSRAEQETARKKLKASGLLEEKDDRLAHKLWFRVNRGALDSAIQAWLDSGIPGCGNPASGDAETRRPSNYEETTYLSPAMRSKRVRKEKKPKTPPSERGLSFADWFRKLLPEDMALLESWRESWAAIYDDLIRLDNRNPSEIAKVCQWARTDDFWGRNFMSPSKLRTRDPNGINYFDSFKEKMKNDPKHASAESVKKESAKYRDVSMPA